MPSQNKYSMIFRKLKNIFQDDSRTSQYQILGGEYSKKKVLPCVLVFPDTKNWITEPDTRDYRKSALPRQVKYKFNFWAYVSLTELEDAYYNEFEGAKAGLTQVLTELEEVLKDNKTGNDLITTTTQLWTDIEWESVDISQKPGKLMHGKLSCNFISKELS